MAKGSLKAYGNLLIELDLAKGKNHDSGQAGCDVRPDSRIFCGTLWRSFKQNLSRSMMTSSAKFNLKLVDTFNKKDIEQLYGMIRAKVDVVTYSFVILSLHDVVCKR